MPVCVRQTTRIILLIAVSGFTALHAARPFQTPPTSTTTDISTNALKHSLISASIAGRDHNSSSSSSSRALLSTAACSASSSKLLVNGYFSLDDDAHAHNVLVAATMANDAYPWASGVGGAPLESVIDGLSPQQVEAYQQKFTAKYKTLGATSVQFVDYYSPTKDIAAHAIVIGTPNSVFLVFRGTADVWVFMTSMDTSLINATISNKPVQIYQAPYRSVMGAWPEVLSAVEKAIRATGDPSSAKIYVCGHSLGGASAFLAALLLVYRGYQIGGVYAFGPYMTGATCAPGEGCWVDLYDRALGGITHVWWNNQDPIPALMDYVYAKKKTQSTWGHVPRNRGWVRIVGDDCIPSSGTRLEEPCPPEIDAVDGKADGECSGATVKPHLPWIYLQKIARCVLLPTPGQQGYRRFESALRLDKCNEGAVWTALLSLPVPNTASFDSNVEESSPSGLQASGMDKRPNTNVPRSTPKPGLRL